MRKSAGSSFLLAVRSVAGRMAPPRRKRGSSASELAGGRCGGEHVPFAMCDGQQYVEGEWNCVFAEGALPATSMWHRCLPTWRLLRVPLLTSQHLLLALADGLLPRSLPPHRL